MDVLEKVDGAAKIIGTTPSTVKKYYLLFEQEGYKFKRSQEGHILFSNHDIDLLKELIILKNQPGMTVLKAVKEIVRDEVITDTTDITNTTMDITVMAKQVTTVMTEITELKQLVKEQNEFIRQQQKYIDDRLEQRDRNLMAAIRDSQEVKKQLMQIAVAREAEKNKKGFFARLFNKE